MTWRRSVLVVAMMTLLRAAPARAQDPIDRFIGLPVVGVELRVDLALAAHDPERTPHTDIEREDLDAVERQRCGRS